MTFEELLLAEQALRKRGYGYFFRLPASGRLWTLRARKHPMASAVGRQEQILEVRSPADLARILCEPP